MRPHLRAALLGLVPVVLLPAASAGQEPLGPRVQGPVIHGFGEVYSIEAPDFTTPVDAVYRVVFEVAQGAPSPADVNARIDTLARFLNMHVQAGVPRENLKLALVLHGTAGKDALDDQGFQERHGVDNPNLPLLRQLQDFGVRVILCGQTQMHRGLERDRLAPGVEIALSAMTALVTLQEQGYHLISF